MFANGNAGRDIMARMMMVGDMDTYLGICALILVDEIVIMLETRPTDYEMKIFCEVCA